MTPVTGTHPCSRLPAAAPEQIIQAVRDITAAESAAGSVPGVVHAHARARWTGRTLRVEVEGWVDPDLTARDADALGRRVAGAIARQLPQAGSLTWTSRAALG